MNSASAAVNTKYNVEIESIPTLLAASEICIVAFSLGCTYI
jgi:hypothetical protein